jgi:mono/diheme cytochrome c family protein
MPASGSSRSSRVPRCHLAIAAAIGAALIATACSKGERGTSGSESTAAAAPAGTTAAPSTQAPGGAAANTTASGGAVAGSTAAGGANAVTNANVSPSSITAKEVALGDSIYHGQAAGGLCFTCHGADAKGTQLAPPLIKDKWITGDGSYGFLVARITAGVPNPTPPYPGPMLPKGGAPLTDAQVQAVAAYVYSLNHPNVGKKSS